MCGFLAPAQSAVETSETAMADEKQVARLWEGVDEWNRWRWGNPGVRPDLIRADLFGAILREANLSEADLTGANLRGANLSAAILRGADLRRAELSAAHLRWAHLRGADLSGVLSLEQWRHDSALGDRSTKLPDGLHHPERWPQESPETPS